jgi:hypothetical protein
MPDSKLIIPRDIALLSSDDVYKALDNSGKGLTTTQVAERRARFGANLLSHCLYGCLISIQTY